MLWVKKLFGISMLAYGIHYVLLAFAPRFASYIVPVALVLGGLYLGFIEKSAAKRKNFVLLKRTVGVAGVALSIVLFPAPPKQLLEFRPYDAAAVQQALASGKPVILDFSADWCAPCHRLDRETFSSPAVIAAAKRFEVFKVDLTHTGSPEVEQRTRQFQIKGVPTVVFLGPSGSEIPGLRFSEFLPPMPFLEKMKLAAATARPG